MIKRSPRPESNFYLLDKAISEDRKVGWAARGMLVFLLGKPDNWIISPAALVNETLSALRPTGRDGVYAILKELRDAGYIRVTDARSDDGNFAGTEYVAYESPHPGNPDTVVSPHTEKPDTASEASPHTALPCPVNPTQVSIEENQGLKGKKGLKGYDVSADFVDVDPQVLTDWLALRAKRRAPVTATVAKSIRTESGKAGMSVEDAMRMCCLKGWQGFDSSWVQRDQHRGSGETAYAKSMREKYEVVAPSVAAQSPANRNSTMIFDTTQRISHG